jgi:rhombotail lipoprotein
MNWKRAMRWVLASAAMLGLATGCIFWDATRRNGERTSLLEFLSPENSSKPMSPTIPTLNLPLRVGLAWVPSDPSRGGGYSDPPLPEEFLLTTLAKVRSQFTNLPFVADVQLVPQGYLQPGGGFVNLDQVRSLLGIDVIALVSRDQKQFSDPNALSFLYLTIVGAYTVPAGKNETFSMVDTAVFDIQSRTLLFRAPGMHRSAGHSAYVGLDLVLRRDRQEGLVFATENMAVNLKAELASFQERIKTQPETVRIVKRPGYTGAGAGGWMDLAWIGMVLVVGWAVSGARRTQRESLRVAPVRRSTRA